MKKLFLPLALLVSVSSLNAYFGSGPAPINNQNQFKMNEYEAEQMIKPTGTLNNTVVPMTPSSSMQPSTPSLGQTILQLLTSDNVNVQEVKIAALQTALSLAAAQVNASNVAFSTFLQSPYAQIALNANYFQQEKFQNFLNNVATKFGKIASYGPLFQTLVKDVLVEHTTGVMNITEGLKTVAQLNQGRFNVVLSDIINLINSDVQNNGTLMDQILISADVKALLTDIEGKRQILLNAYPAIKNIINSNVTKHFKTICSVDPALCEFAVSKEGTVKDIVSANIKATFANMDAFFDVINADVEGLLAIFQKVSVTLDQNELQEFVANNQSMVNQLIQQATSGLQPEETFSDAMYGKAVEAPMPYKLVAPGIQGPESQVPNQIPGSIAQPE